MDGRVEIYHSNSWGTICDDHFDTNNNGATVVCRQLGFDQGSLIPSSQLSDGSGSIWLDDVNCNGDESKIIDCRHSDWNNHNCGHSEDTGVNCQYYLDRIEAFLTNITNDFENLMKHKTNYIVEDIDKIARIEKTLNVLSEKTQDIKQRIDDTITPKIHKYRTWNLEQILHWIAGLENGRFKHYIDGLRTGFQSDGIVKGEYLPRITAANLREKPFQIMNLMDRNDLVAKFQSLLHADSNTILKGEM